MEIDISQTANSRGVEVRVIVRLTSREMSRLFMAGDTLIQLPLEGALPDDDKSPIPRMSIFLSELTAAREGLVRTFVDAANAEEYARVVHTQLESGLEAP